MKLILLVVSVLLLTIVFIKLQRVQIEGYEGNTWEDLWNGLTTRTGINNLTKFFESDMTTTKPPKNVINANKKDNLTLKDIVIKASINSAIDDTGEPSATQLLNVIRDGYRFIELHVYMVSGNTGNILYVGNPAENVDATSSQLPLSKALQIINENAFVNKNANVEYNYSQDPLFIQFMLHRDRDTTADMLDALYNNYLNPAENNGLIDNTYWHRTGANEATVVDRNTVFSTIKRKALFGFNVQNLVDLYSTARNANDVPIAKRRVLKKMCNFKTGGHSWASFSNYKGLKPKQTRVIEGGLQTDATQLHIVLPPLTLVHNPNIYDIVFKYQIQTVPMLAYLNDEGVDTTNQLFNDSNTSTIPLATVLAIAKSMV